jgi:hypothetical protein
MGKEIEYSEEWYEGLEQNIDQSPTIVAQLLRQARQLSPSDLRLYFESMFCRMTPTSKEAMTEIMWRGLTPGEQQCFEVLDNSI